MRTWLNYDAVKVDGPKKKILEFNSELNILDAKELKTFELLCSTLSDKGNFYKTKIDDNQSKLLDRLFSFPIDKIFPCLDLYRIFLVHPDSVLHYKKYEEGWTHINSLLGVLTEKEAGDPAKMLSLRCLTNLFKDSSAMHVLREKRWKIINIISAHLQNPKSNVREAAITTILNYSISFLLKDDPEGKTQCLTALGVVSQEQDNQCKMRMQAAVTNLTFKNQAGKDLAKQTGLM